MICQDPGGQIEGKWDMGASGWTYTVAYQPDVAAALRQLRHEVFDRGEYYRTDELDPRYALTEAEFLATLDPADEDSGINEHHLSDWRAAQRDGRAALVGVTPTDPDSLLASQPYSGTHSIIDMCRVSAGPALFAVSPLTDEQTLACFGTPTPTPDHVEEWIARFGPLPAGERWQGTYVVSYLDGEPARLHFTGFSGD